VLVKDKTTSVKGIMLNPANTDWIIRRLALCYEHSKWHSLAIWYKPAVGSTVNGLVSFGVDYDDAIYPSTRQVVCGYTPSTTTAVWQDTESKKIRVSGAKLQSRAWFAHQLTGDKIPDKCPGTVVYGITADAPSVDKIYGELWIDADITFAGFQPVQS